MAALEDAGRLTPEEYQRTILYSTLSPCDMCSGAALLYKIPRVVVGENRTFVGAEALLRSRGVELMYWMIIAVLNYFRILSGRIRLYGARTSVFMKMNWNVVRKLARQFLGVILTS